MLNGKLSILDINLNKEMMKNMKLNILNYKPILQLTGFKKEMYHQSKIREVADHAGLSLLPEH